MRSSSFASKTRYYSILGSPLGAKIYHANQLVSPLLQWRLYVLALIISDALMMFGAFRLSYYIRFEGFIQFFTPNAMINIGFYQMLAMIIVPLWLIIYALRGLYTQDKVFGGAKEYSDLFNSSIIGMIFIMAAQFLFPDFVIARGWMLMSWFLAYLMSTIGRIVSHRVIRYLRTHGFFLNPAVIIGANDEGILLADQLANWQTSGFYILGFVDKKLAIGTTVINNLKILGDLKHLDEIIERYGVKELILATSAITSRDKMVEIFKQYGVNSDVKVRLSSGLYEIITTGLTVNQYAYVPLVGVNPVRMTGIDQAIKLILDYSIAIPVAAVLIPLFVVVGIMVKIDSPGPAIHRRRVVGVNGKEFDAFKFRTMAVDGDKILEKFPELQAELAINHKLKDDPRVTRLGKFIRKYSIDELPQIFNVLRNEMSLVGPRMITRPEVSKYDKWDLNLLTVRPGITGLWQVSGRSNLSYEERVRLDMYYIRNWNIWLDLQLLLQTIPAVLKGRGAF